MSMENPKTLKNISELGNLDPEIDNRVISQWGKLLTFVSSLTVDHEGLLTGLKPLYKDLNQQPPDPKAVKSLDSMVTDSGKPPYVRQEVPNIRAIHVGNQSK